MTLTERGVASGGLGGLADGARMTAGLEAKLGLTDYVNEIVASGFPGLRGLSPRALRSQLTGYARNIVDRDVPQQGVEVCKPDALLDWMRVYAAATSTTASYTEILDASTAGVSDKLDRRTAMNYRDILRQLWALDAVPAWTASGSTLTRLQSSPKHNLVDPALAESLLGLSREALLDGEGRRQSTALGLLFESLVTLCVRVPSQAAEMDVFHLRTRNGDHEVDLILARPDGRVFAVEVKLSSTVTDRDGRICGG